RLAVFRLVPAAGLEVCSVGGDAAVQRQQQREGQFGNGDGVLARAVGHVDAARRGRRHVNRVVARPCPDDEAQAARRQRRRGHFRAATDENLRPCRADRRRQRGIVQLRVIDDVDTRPRYGVTPGLGESVRDQYLHWLLSP